MGTRQSFLKRLSAEVAQPRLLSAGGILMDELKERGIEGNAHFTVITSGGFQPNSDTCVALVS
jgi:hypothetical protein